jgi:hypothetical protein
VEEEKKIKSWKRLEECKRQGVTRKIGEIREKKMTMIQISRRMGLVVGGEKSAPGNS